MAHNKPSHLDLRYLTFSLITSHINFFPSDSLFKKVDDINLAPKELKWL